MSLQLIHRATIEITGMKSKTSYSFTIAVSCDQALPAPLRTHPAISIVKEYQAARPRSGGTEYAVALQTYNLTPNA